MLSVVETVVNVRSTVRFRGVLVVSFPCRPCPSASPLYTTRNVPLVIKFVSVGVVDPTSPLFRELGLPSWLLCSPPIPLLTWRRSLIVWLVSEGKLAPALLSTISSSTVL